MNHAYLCRLALDRLFLDEKYNGFWGSRHGRINAKLIHNRSWKWKPSSDPCDRYGVFALAAILLAKKINGLDTSRYDESIARYLKYLKDNHRAHSLSTLTYGTFNALVLGDAFYPQLKLFEEASKIYRIFRKKINSPYDNQHALLLIGAAAFLDVLKKTLPQDEYTEHLNYFKRLAKIWLSSQDEKGFFQSGDIRAFHHQRTMYVLWGLCSMSRHCLCGEIRYATKKTIKYVWFHGRSSADDAFLWHPPAYWVKSRWGFSVPAYLPGSSRYLFSCHQTFFANAVFLFQVCFKENIFGEEARRAMDWIFGYNRIRKDLVDLTGLDVPTRIMLLSGDCFVKGENFKGSYEIGSYILALSFLSRLDEKKE